MRNSHPDFSHDIDFLYELGTLRFLSRTWVQFGGTRMANDPEHTFRVAFLAWLIASREGADTSHVLKLALVHDIAESRTGDVHHISRLYTTRDEESAILDMTTDTSLQGELRDLWREYEWRQSLESQIVKDADTLDVDLEIMESIARGETFSQALFDKRPVVHTKLFTQTAKQLVKQIRTSNPNLWPLATKNRFTAGDWQK